jgi:hypothetical protein
LFHAMKPFVSHRETKCFKQGNKVFHAEKQTVPNRVGTKRLQ